MAFDDNWEAIFSQQEWGKYPNEDVIRFTARNFYSAEDRQSIRILDLGCGGGATTWYLAREGFDVYSVDGSPSAIKQATAYLRHENLSATFTVADFVQLDFDNGFFDAVYDLGAIQHNTKVNIEKIYREVARVLKPGGLFFSSSINVETSGQDSAEQVEENTFLHLNSINADVLVHLFTEKELRNLMNLFKNVTIDSTLRSWNNGKAQIGHYLVSGVAGSSK
ncbi:MAG: class I SAM-dependent methyltransferase [Pseudodesulfovibrio sp.]|nr:class I SAM-dependent methyltransferase [Pseudodesulfovibrio sp.]